MNQDVKGQRINRANQGFVAGCLSSLVPPQARPFRSAAFAIDQIQFWTRAFQSLFLTASKLPNPMPLTDIPTENKQPTLQPAAAPEVVLGWVESDWFKTWLNLARHQ